MMKKIKTPSCNKRFKKGNWPGQARAKILYFVSGRAGLGPKFQFLGPGRNFFLYFGPGRAEIVPMPDGPGPDWKIGPMQTSNVYYFLKWRYILFFDFIKLSHIYSKNEGFPENVKNGSMNKRKYFLKYVHLNIFFLHPYWFINLYMINIQPTGLYYISYTYRFLENSGVLR